MRKLKNALPSPNLGWFARDLLSMAQKGNHESNAAEITRYCNPHQIATLMLSETLGDNRQSMIE